MTWITSWAAASSFMVQKPDDKDVAMSVQRLLCFCAGFNSGDDMIRASGLEDVEIYSTYPQRRDISYVSCYHMSSKHKPNKL